MMDWDLDDQTNLYQDEAEDKIKCLPIQSHADWSYLLDDY